MHTGVISFCDRISYNIKSSDVKDVILHDLNARFNVKILQKHWHRLDVNNKDHLQRSPHWMMLRSNGNPYYMYLTRYEDVNQIMFIDKKVHPGYEKPRIILIRGQFHDDLFDNTLLEGEMVKDKHGQWIFLINDLIGYRNSFLQQEALPKRINRVYEMLKQGYRMDPLMDVCQFHVKKFFPCIQSEWESVLNLVEKLPYTNRGLYFWPFYLKFKPKLVNFDDTLIQTVSRKVKDDPMFRESTVLPPPPPLPKLTGKPAREQSPRLVEAQSQHRVTTATSVMATAHGSNNKVLTLRKTENPDVYDVFENDQSTNSKIKVGQAHIPSLQASKRLRLRFKDVTVAQLIPYECEFNETFQKWTPIKEA